MSIAVAIKHMMAAGMSPEAIVAAVAEMEAALPKARTAGAARQERYRTRLALKPREWAAICEEVKLRDGNQCAYCGGSEGQMHVDHVVPLIQGGSNEMDNLAVACRSCNTEKSGRTVEQWRARK